jgi:hypothetical protein
MAFVLNQTATYTWLVSFDMPIDGTRFRRETFEAVFKRLPQSRVEEIMAAEQELRIAFERGTGDLKALLPVVRAHAAEVMAGWNGIKDVDGGEDLPFTQSTLEELLEVPMMASSILQAYGDSLQKAKVKN